MSFVRLVSSSFTDFLREVLSSPLDCQCLLVRQLVPEVAGLLEQLLGSALEQSAGVQRHLKFTRGEKARREASDEILGCFQK